MTDARELLETIADYLTTRNFGEAETGKSLDEIAAVFGSQLAALKNPGS